MWYCDVVVMALDVQSRGVKFDSELFQFHVLMLDILFTHMAVTWPWLRGFGADQRTVCSSCCCSLAYVPKSLERHLCQWDRLWLLEDRAGQDRYPWNERILVQEQKKNTEEKQIPPTISMSLCKWSSQIHYHVTKCIHWKSGSPQRGCIRWPPSDVLWLERSLCAQREVIAV